MTESDTVTDTNKKTSNVKYTIDILAFNQPGDNPHFVNIMKAVEGYEGLDKRLIFNELQKLTTFVEAITVLKAIHYLPKQYQTVRGLELVFNISRTTISHYIQNFGYLFTEGGESK